MIQTSALAVGIAVCLGSPLGGQTREDAQALVKKAIEYAKANGTYKLIQAVNRQDPELRQGELYVWIVDLEEKIMAAHGANPKLVGQDFSGARDPDGVAYAVKAVEIATASGSGWLDYKFKHPVTQQIETKTCYVEKHKIFVVACGVYKK
jgi:signal transduction histidine kinase